MILSRRREGADSENSARGVIDQLAIGISHEQVHSLSKASFYLQRK